MVITRMTSGSWGKVRAFFDVKIGGFTLKGFKLVEGNDGFFVGNPNYKGKDGEYHDFCFVEADDRKKLIKLAEKKHFGLDQPDSEPGGSYDDGVKVEKETVDEDIPF